MDIDIDVGAMRRLFAKTAPQTKGLAMVAGNYRPRIVITGLGVVSPVGIGKATFWSNLLAGRSGIAPLTTFQTRHLPCKLAAEIRDFDPLEHISQKKFLKVMSRDIQLGVSAATLAMKDAGLKAGDIDPDRLGVEFGAGHISFTPDELRDVSKTFSGMSKEQIASEWGAQALENISPLWLLRQCPNMPACHVAIEHNARGPNNTITSSDASALLALQEAIRCINRGQVDAMIVGASSSNINPVDIARLSTYDTLSPQNDPEEGCRPFDRLRDGTIVGEGSAVFVVERYEHAVARGADIYCEILGIGAGCDGRGDENVVGGRGLSTAINSAIRFSGISPKELGHINAHGKSTFRDDWLESKAYHTSLGDATANIPVVALKSYFGNFDAGSGAVELAGSILAMKYGELPATLNYKHPDPLCRLNVSRDPQTLRTSIGMSVNRTSMGQSAAAIMRVI